jgi:hypothetical protein
MSFPVGFPMSFPIGFPSGFPMISLVERARFSLKHCMSIRAVSLFVLSSFFSVVVA